MIKRWLARRSARLVVLVVVVGGVAAGVAYATGSIPGANGTIQGCYDSGGNLKVVASLPCAKGYTALAWSQTGPAGKDGTNGTNGTNGKDGAAGKDGTNGTNGKDGADGVSVTSATEPAGNNCATGGSKFTAANANVTYACNGAQGDTGQTGAAGPVNLATLQGTPCTYKGDPSSVSVSQDADSGAITLTCNPLYEVSATINNGSMSHIQLTYFTDRARVTTTVISRLPVRR